MEDSQKMEMVTEKDPDEAILSAKARLPEHVVHRSFVKETVVLSLQTGRYHGLNPTAGHMLAVLQRTGTVREAVDQLAGVYDRTRGEMESDMIKFCRDLIERNLIELVRGEDR